MKKQIAATASGAALTQVSANEKSPGDGPSRKRRVRGAAAPDTETKAESGQLTLPRPATSATEPATAGTFAGATTAPAALAAASASTPAAPAVPASASTPGFASSPSTKAKIVLKKLRAPRGTTVLALMQETGWQAHSVRGFLSGTIRKKLGLNLTSEIGRDGVRRYRVAAQA